MEKSEFINLLKLKFLELENPGEIGFVKAAISDFESGKDLKHYHYMNLRFFGNSKFDNICTAIFAASMNCYDLAERYLKNGSI